MKMISICKWKKCGIIKNMDEKELSELQKEMHDKILKHACN